jgi:PAS domain S-box-containing protein
MAEQKQSTTLAHPSLAEIGEVLAHFDRAETPGRLLRTLTNALTHLTGVPVSAFSYNSAGACDAVDDHILPAEIRGRAEYPERNRDARGITTKTWPSTPDTQKLASEIGAVPVKLELLTSAGVAHGGVVFWKTYDLDQAGRTAVEVVIRTAATSLHRIQLADEVKNNLAQTMTLQRITQAITRSLDFDQVASTLLRHARKLIHVDAVALALAHPDKSKQEYYIDQAIGLSDEYVSSAVISGRSEVVQQLAKSATPLQIFDVRDAPLTDNPAMVAKEGIKSVLLAPIFSGGIPVGALSLVSKTPRHFNYSELRFAQSLAEQAGIAFANANLHASLRKASNEIEQTRNLMRDGLLVLDMEAKLRYFNAAAAGMMDLAPRNLGKVLPRQKDRPAGLEFNYDQAYSAIQGAIRGRLGTYNFTFKRPKQPDSSYFEAICAPYKDTKGALVGALVNIRDITMLYHEKEKLQTIQDNIQDGLMILDEDGLAQSFNREWQRLFNITEDLIGQRFFTGIAPERDILFDRPPTEFIQEVYDGKRVTTYAHIGATNRHIQLSVGPIMTGKQVTGAVATGRDITPLIEKTVEANEMAAKAQRHLRELSQLAELSGIVGFNVSNIYQKYLSKTATLLGSTSVSIYLYNPGPGRLERRGTLSPPAGDTATIELDSNHPAAKAFASRKAVSLNAGDARPHQLATPITHHSKTLGTLLASRTNREFSEHDAGLARLVATRLAVLIENASLYHDVNSRRERWEAVFRFTEEGIVIFDRTGNIVGFNPASTEITGYGAAEVIGKPFGKVLKTISQSSPGPNPLTRVLTNGVTITKSEQLIENRTGGRVWTEISYSPIFDDAGRVTSGLAIIRDTTRDREIEEIKSDFISIVSHELRTPLTAIKGFLSMTLKQDFGSLSEKQYHYLSRVYQSNQRMINLVEDLMDVTYIESGKINLNIGPVAMESIISEVVSELAAKGAANQIMINVRRRQRLPLVLADETRLHQIVLNLVDNAIKYSMPGTEVNVDFRIEGDDLITTVSDHGVGISKSQIDRLFTKFGRIFNPLSIQAGGTGLGLYIVKNLVESHNGRIWATSQEGKGSKFHFSLPIAKQLPLLE